MFSRNGRILIDGIEIQFEFSSHVIDNSLEHLNSQNSKPISSKYVLWNIKNFLEAGKTAATQEKIAYFLAKYFPRLSVGNSAFARWMCKPFDHLLPNELKLLTCGEIELLRDYLSKRTHRMERLHSERSDFSQCRACLAVAKQPNDFDPILHENKEPSSGGVFCNFSPCSTFLS